jgi:dihydrofolate reductase
MRKLIGGMKVSLDGMVAGPQGVADWVPAWSEDFGLTSQVDACLLGGGMYGGYEQYWTAIQNHPETPIWITDKVPTEAEIDWARFATQVPHYVLSTTTTSVSWPNTKLLRDLRDVAQLKQEAGKKDIYVIGGARTTATLIGAGLLDELRLIVYPLLAGEGIALFPTHSGRRDLELQDVQALQESRVMLTYTVKSGSAGMDSSRERT